MEFTFTRKADLNKFVRGLRKHFIVPVVDGKVVQVYNPAGLKEPERIMRFADNLYKSIVK
jgi:multidrug efflux pump subunit AcrA (membrane-fusion protein)